MWRRTLTVAAIAAALSLAPAGAPARAEAAAAPFDGSLQRLAEILGALHYLRNICGANEGQKWRNEMQAIVDAEAPSGDRRLRMIASFNRGYRGYQQSYRTCTPAAELVIRRYPRGRFKNRARDDRALRELSRVRVPTPRFPPFVPARGTPRRSRRGDPVAGTQGRRL